MLRKVFPYLLVSLVAAGYLVFSVLILNFRLLVGVDGLPEKIGVAFSLLFGAGHAWGWWMIFLNLAVGILAGVNIYLIWNRLTSMKISGGVELSVGGGMVLGLASAGCGACGITLLGFLGLASVTLLPFRGLEISILSLALLTVSVFWLLRTGKAAACEVGAR